MHRPLLSLVLALVPLLAHAEVWTDPSLADAIRDAELIVRASAPKDGSKGQPTVTFTADALLKGTLESGASLVVGNLHDPTRAAGPTFQPGETVLLILRRSKEGALEVPTPTFGRFPIRDGVVKYAALRDTYLRLDVPLGDFQTFVALHLGRRDDAWIAARRADLESGDPDRAEGEALMRLYLALETLAIAGEPSDREHLARYLVSKSPFQLRVSACRAAAGAVGTAAAGRLLHVAKTDEEPAVRTAAIRELAGLQPRPPKLAQKLAALLDDAPTKEVLFSGLNDPRLNKWPSPKGALLRVIRRVGAAPVKTQLLKVVAEPAPADVFGAALKALITLKGDRALPAQLVRCFRAKGEVSGELYNTEICVALERLTGEKLGTDADAWRAYVEKN